MRTLLVLLALAPPLLSIGYFQFAAQQVWHHRQEGPWIRQAKFMGNQMFSNKKLAKVIGASESLRLNAYTATDSLRKLKTFYAQAGFAQARVTLLEGARRGDKALAFRIVEGQRRSP